MILFPELPRGHARPFFKDAPVMALGKETEGVGHRLVGIIGIQKLLLGKVHLLPGDVIAEVDALLPGKEQATEKMCGKKAEARGD